MYDTTEVRKSKIKLKVKLQDATVIICTHKTDVVNNVMRYLWAQMFVSLSMWQKKTFWTDVNETVTN